MNAALEMLIDHLLRRLLQVQAGLGRESTIPPNAGDRFADQLDSMAMVEFLMLVAEDCGVSVTRLEECANHRYSTIADLATALHSAGLSPKSEEQIGASAPLSAALCSPNETSPCWLAATAFQLPDTVQSAEALNTALEKPSGWLQRHAGIEQRHVWADQDPLAAAVSAGCACLAQARVLPDQVGALLVTSEAPPQLAGLGAALHALLDLQSDAPALEIGGACTGFLAALWNAQFLISRLGSVLILSVEAPSRLLGVAPGLAGEAAALFGDGVAACLVSAGPSSPDAVAIKEVTVSADGKAGSLIRVVYPGSGPVRLQLAGRALAGRVVATLAQSVRSLTARHGIGIDQLRAIVVHGGNGRLPALLARQLGLPAERVWSETAHTGNLGSASLPVAWAAHKTRPAGPIAWAAIGAGITWGTALTE